jgi:hypothetical protein
VFAEDDDFSGADGLIVIELGEESVGGRAARTAFGGEELDEDGCAARFGSLGGGRGRREGEDR